MVKKTQNHARVTGIPVLHFAHAASNNEINDSSDSIYSKKWNGK